MLYNILGFLIQVLIYFDLSLRQPLINTRHGGAVGRMLVKRPESEGVFWVLAQHIRAQIFNTTATQVITNIYIAT